MVARGTQTLLSWEQTQRLMRKHLKENSCGCAGCYSAWSAIELYAQVFDELNALEHLEGFREPQWG